jgi:hypothetical protein
MYMVVEDKKKAPVGAFLLKKLSFLELPAKSSQYIRCSTFYLCNA